MKNFVAQVAGIATLALAALPLAALTTTVHAQTPGAITAALRADRDLPAVVAIAVNERAAQHIRIASRV